MASAWPKMLGLTDAASRWGDVSFISPLGSDIISIRRIIFSSKVNGFPKKKLGSEVPNF
jgi:hypothetical protein